MSVHQVLLPRSQSCELCTSQEKLFIYELPPSTKTDLNRSVLICETCNLLKSSPEENANHWRCLNEAIWSEHEAVKMLSYRILQGLKKVDWARDLLDQLYLEDEALQFAKLGLAANKEADSSAPTRDSNGSLLQDGDCVTLIKDLEVKGAGFTAKRGTLVKNISLSNNPKHIEGKVNGIQIVLVAAYLKKA